jgi:hypothetical protein
MTVTEEKIPGQPSDVGHDLEGQGINPSKTAQKRLTSKKSSILAISDDPFAPREGKTLLWKNVNMTLVSCLSVSCRLGLREDHF